MNIRNLVTLGIFAGLLTSIAAHAKPGDMFGWDILCKGAQGLEIRVNQSSDDQKIYFKGPGWVPQWVWAAGSSEYDSEREMLLFQSDPEEIRVRVTLALHRENKKGPGFAMGTASILGDRHDLKCYARFSKTQEGYAEMAAQPFPKF